MNTETPEQFYTRWKEDKRDPKTRWLDMPLTWSQLSSWRYSKKEWYDKYFLGKEQYTTDEMRFGNIVGDRIASDPSFMPEIPRLPYFEYVVEFDDKIKLRSHLDNYLPHTTLHEFKTGIKPWNQSRVDKHEQIDFYYAMLYLVHHIKPKDLQTTLFWLPTKEVYTTDEHGVSRTIELTGELCTFLTSRTMMDVIKLLASVKRERKLMLEYIEHRQ